LYKFQVLFEYFDRLLLLGKGGKVTYFGNIGDNSRVLLEYFERNGARRCTPEENPAEYPAPKKEKEKRGIQKKKR
jgi:ATP-binding cassette subfamily G (WHITE) protein 2 (SNQ2)